MYGHIPRKHQDALRRFVRGARVVDLGCGDMERTWTLLGCDPEAVLAVDSHLPSSPKAHPRLTLHQGLFNDSLGVIRDFRPTVAHVSWPANYLTGLVKLLTDIPTVIYVGCNTDGTACGERALFQYMLTRKMVRYLPDRQNTLIVVTKLLDNPRDATYEEKAALDQTEVYPYRA